MYRFSKKHSSARVEAFDHPATAPFKSIPASYGRHFTALLAFGITLAISFSLYDEIRCKVVPESDCHIPTAFLYYGTISEGNWSQNALIAYIALGYPAWGFALAIMTNYAADGHGGVIRDFLAHPVFVPLARLSFTVYMVHLISVQWFFAMAPAAVYTSPLRQLMDSIAFAGLGFGFALILYLLVEKPCSTLLPYLFGLEREVRMSQREIRQPSLHLNSREFAVVSAVESEPVLSRQGSVDLEQPLMSRHSAND